MEFKPVTFKIPVIATEKTKPLLWAIGAALVLAVVIWVSSSYSYDNALKRANKENRAKIDSIQATKVILLDSLASIAQRINKKEAVISTLTARENDLKSKLKYYRYENDRIKNNYRNSTISQRVKLWAELTTEEDRPTRTN